MSMRACLTHACVGAVIATIAATPTPTRAEVSTFLSRAFWEFSLDGPPAELVTFNNYTTDVVFEDAPVDVGPFTFRTNIGGPFSTGIVNFIDAVPYATDSSNNGVPINGSTYARLGVNNDISDRGDTTVSLLYDQPILAWAANFTAAANQEMVDLALFTNPGSPPIIVPLPISDGFFGVILNDADAGISEVQFRSRLTLNRTEFFGMDNVRFVTVPEPAGPLTLGLLAWRSRRSRHLRIRSRA
ncbi:MAG: hypothetical protein AAF328_05620 [Planctomycetota bacterium]